MGLTHLPEEGRAQASGSVYSAVLAFADVPLWDSDVTGDVTLANQVVSMQSPPAVPYAGWNTPTNRRIGVQQSFNTVIDGIPVDLNTFALD